MTSTVTKVPAGVRKVCRAERSPNSDSSRATKCFMVAGGEGVEALYMA